MGIVLVNPPEKRRIWAGVAESMAYGVYCFPPLGPMYLQASIETSVMLLRGSQTLYCYSLHHR